MGWGFKGTCKSDCLGRGRLRFAACLGLIGLGSQALALGLGDPSVTSVLGQPLQLTVPLVTDPGTELTQDCVRIVPGTQIGDAIPSLNAGRITIEPERGQLRIEGLQPVTEPALRVTVEAGCNERIRREFSLLVDPPSMGLGQSAGPGSAQAALGGIGLGMAQISAVLGQRLSIRVPAVGPDAGTLTEQCVHLADPISSEGAPVLHRATIRVSPQPTGALIEVATPEPVIEPAVRIALDVGCRDPLRREYAILLGLPTLAVSNLTAEEPPAPVPEAKPAPRPVAKAPPRAAAVPVVPGPTRPAAAAPAQVAVEPVAKPARRAPTGDRLVLGSPDDSIRPAPNMDVAAAAPDVNAELAKRVEAMSRQVEALETQLAASRLRQQELERQAADARERWTWMMGAFGVLLLGSALLLAWRQRVPAPQSGWGPVVGQPAPLAGAQPKVVAARPELAIPVPEIGGRATMPGRSISATTEPSIPDDRHTHITVTELHDTVQVIKELYATVLERNTSGSVVAPQRPLELDLRTPAVGAAAAESPPRLLGDPVPPGGLRVGSEREAASDERFTELPTEVGLDLDLSSALIPVEGEAFDLPRDRNASGRAPVAPQPNRAAPPSPARDGVPVDSLTQAPTEVSLDIDVGPSTGFPGTIERPAATAQASVRSTLQPARAAEPSHDREGFPAESLTQVPTEVSLDIDVGPSSGFPRTDFPRTIEQPTTRQRAEADRPARAGTALGPIDLQLDLNQPASRNKRRDGKSG